MRKTTLVLAVFLTATMTLGQALTIGSTYGGSPNSSDLNGGPTRTNVSLLPATASGTISTVHVYWSTAGCTNALKFKFFHRTGNSLTLIAERGPFTPSQNDFTTQITPVTVQQGDLIGVARISNCGNAGSLVGIVSTGYVQFIGDTTGTVDLGTGTASGAPLFLYGTGTATSSVARVVTVVGSLLGGFGSNFKTQVQLFNPGATAINGTLIYHPASTSGGFNDPSTPYAIAPGHLFVFNDIVANMGQTGLGSLDFVVPTGQSAPIAVSRVFNDAGAGGTSGFTEDLLPTTGDNRVMFQGATGFMIAPADPSATRFNIGIRSLFQGATLTAVLKDANGNTLATVTKTYQPNWFEQVSAQAFFGVATIGPNNIVQISVSSGSALIYGSSTDNTTNDPSIQFMVVTSAIA
jgi:hypothetical protein